MAHFFVGVRPDKKMGAQHADNNKRIAQDRGLKTGSRVTVADMVGIYTILSFDSRHCAVLKTPGGVQMGGTFAPAQITLVAHSK